MSDSVRTVEIDRMRLTGLVTPERAERIRALAEVELQHLLEREGWPDGLVGGDVPHLHVPAMHLAEHNNDQHLANGLARSIAQALRGVG